MTPFALAIPVTGLVNTGAGVADNSQDGHYALTVVSGATVLNSGFGYAADQVGWPDAEPWLGADGASKWLTPFEDESLSLDSSSDGVYKWTLTFDLTGDLASATSFSARWATDNLGTVALNGVTIASITSSQGYNSWSEFSANSGFVSGVNTLEFFVINQAQSSGNPTGLRVEFLDSSTVTSGNQVPEPESYALLLGGLGLLSLVSRRQAK